MQTTSANAQQLHTEHQDWISELTFWHNELVFYARVFVRLLGDQNLGKEDTDQMEKLKSRIDNLNNQLEETRIKVAQHELNENANLDDQLGYHEKLREEVKKFEKTFRELKNDVFVFTDREDD
jgi:phosphopantetheine adenylyltransferase